MISSESVAITTSASSGDDRTASYTTPISGFPPISRSILRGRRVEARRAGITAMAFMDLPIIPDRRYFEFKFKAVSCLGWYSPMAHPPGSGMVVLLPHGASWISVHSTCLLRSDAISAVRSSHIK